MMSGRSRRRGWNGSTSTRTGSSACSSSTSRSAAESSIEAQWGFSHAHRSAVYFRAADPAFFARAWKFSIVRNPYDRLVSAFHYLKSGASPKAGRAWAAEVLADVPDFATFAGRLGERGFRERVMTWLHFQPQWYFLCDRSGQLLVDEVGRIEAYNDFIDRFNAAGHGLTLNASVRERKSNHLDWQAYYDAETAARVAGLYARDSSSSAIRPRSLRRRAPSRTAARRWCKCRRRGGGCGGL